jgi:hypothetical protein
MDLPLPEYLMRWNLYSTLLYTSFLILSLYSIRYQQ